MYPPNDIGQLRSQSLFGGVGFGSNRKRKPYEFGAPDEPEESIFKNTYEGIFDQPSIRANSIDELKTANSNKDIPTSEYLELLERLYKPETEATNRFNELLGQFPVREEPGWGDKLVAGGLGLGNVRRNIPGGFKVAEESLNAPFNRDLEEWKEKAGPYREAATLENQANNVERQVAANVAQSTVAQRKIESQERIAEEKARIAEIRARAYAYTQYLDKGYKFDFSGPEIIMTNADGSPPIRTGIETGKVDELTKIELNNAGRLAAAKEMGANALQRVQVSGQGLLVIDGVTYKLDPTTNTYVPAGLPTGTPTRPAAPVRPPAPPNFLERQRLEGERAKEIWNGYPEVRNKYIRYRNGAYQMVDRPIPGPGAFFGLGTDITQADVDKWDAVKKMVDPDYVAPPPGASIPTTSPSPGNTSPGAPSTPASPNTGFPPPPPSISKPLPKTPPPSPAPAGMKWQYSDKGEWRLVPR